MNHRLLLVPLVLGFVAVYLLLPRPRRFPPLWGAAAAALALLSAAWLVVWVQAATVETVLFCIFAGLAVGAGGLLVTQRNPVHAALAFALVVLSTCGLFLLQAAPFLMAATIVVYAGAIVVTFLFVIMLAQQAGLSDADQRSREPVLATVAGFILLGALLYVLQRTYDIRPLETLISQAANAAEQESFPQVAQSLGDAQRFFADFQRAAEAAQGSPDQGLLEEEIANVRNNWTQWQEGADAAEARKDLTRVVEAARHVHEHYGVLRPHAPARKSLSHFSEVPTDQVLPGENVAPLGRALFTDYLLPVELGGMLLLVATIGAIAITGRRKEGPR
jgi:NADH:ubiquinone oxidoreductase subunit 6 (subunit J)